jgi:bacteriophage N4 adsorption protein B
MRKVILCALFGALVAFVAGAVLGAGPFVEPADLDERIRAITETPDDPAVQLYAEILFAFTVAIALLILVSGLDDAFIDACYWLRGLRRKERVIAGAEIAALRGRPQAPFAIMVPAWKESDVIAAMVENTVRTLDYQAYRIFCGVYPNDPATGREVDRMAALYPGRVTRVDVSHDGPTCKADCLNHIVRRVLAEEHSSGTRFAGMVLHDSEDVIHPLELMLFNSMVGEKDLIQLPVFSLPRAWKDLTAGTYIDDFAESHGKDIAVREALIGVVPGAGVATCYSRRCLAALWRESDAEPFNTASLTEDYDLSFRLARMGMAETFAHVTIDDRQFRVAGVTGCTGGVVSTHEYFPDQFKAAYRQRARWVIGIAFQGWRHIGWRGGIWERYFLFRDRKAMVMAPACVLAYLLVLNLILGVTLGSEDLRLALKSFLALPEVSAVLLVNLAFMANRAAQRMYFVGRYYGTKQALLSLLRMPVNNLINFCAVMRAWRQFLLHLATGKKLAWDKTAHVYPDTHLLAPAAAHLKAVSAIVLFCALLVPAPSGLMAAQPLPPRAYQLADQAYKALERGELEKAMDFATRALKLAPGETPLILLQADILSRQGKHAQARELLRPIPAADLGGVGLAQRGYLWLEAENHAAAEADFVAAMDTGQLETEGRANVASELAYLALRRDDERAALHWFEMASAHGRSSPHYQADAGYAAMRLGRNRQAVALLAKALDASHAAPEGQKPFDDNAVYGMRRSIDSLERRWGTTLSLGHSTTPGTAASTVAPAGGDLRVMQAGAEVFYIPERFGFRDGRVLQLYANTFQGVSANEEGYATGSASRVIGLGARYKPLRDYNLVFALERRLAVGDSAGDDDWLVRVGWSEGRQTDWHPTRDSWTTWQVYTESAYFLEAERLIQPFDARIGRSWKLPWHGAVLTPFVGAAGEYDSEQVPRTAAGVGPGVTLRYWFRETAHRAFASYAEFSLQYRFRVTDAERGGGLFGMLAVSF